MTLTNQKKILAGAKAAEFIEDGMIVGLGTGSTASCFIEALVRRVSQGLRIEAVSSSERSLALAKKGGIPTRDLNDIGAIDITVDGADQIDPQKRMVKGGGGALLREKIVAYASREMIIVVDNSKRVERLGGIPLPLEVAEFGWKQTKSHLEDEGFKVAERREGKKLFRTDNGNIILDLQLAPSVKEPEKLDLQLKQIPGILETGFFFHLAGRVVVGEENGSVTVC